MFANDCKTQWVSMPLLDPLLSHVEPSTKYQVPSTMNTFVNDKTLAVKTG